MADAKELELEDVEAAADVFVFGDDQVNELVKAGALQSVDATFTYDPAETNSEETVAAASQDGKLYAYPLTASNGYFLYYNSEYLGSHLQLRLTSLERKLVWTLETAGIYTDSSQELDVSFL